MTVLGLKIGGHDPGAALITRSQGEEPKVLAIAEERLTRIKHAPHAFPSRSIEYLLSGFGITPGDVDLIVYDDAIHEEGFKTGAEKMEWIRKRLGHRFATVKIVNVDHHDAHAATAFFCSPFEEAAILVYDGNGSITPDLQGEMSMETESFYQGKDNSLTLIRRALHAAPLGGGFPFSYGIGRLYENLSANYIGFGPHNEGKMMGLAAYGNDSFLKEFPYERWVATYNGGLICNARVHHPSTPVTGFIMRSGTLQKLLADIYNGVRARGKKLLRGIGRSFKHSFLNQKRYPELFEPIHLKKPARNIKSDTLPDAYYSSVAYAAQKIFERYAIELGHFLKRVVKSENLCIAGGCALNIDANRNFLTEVGFKKIFVQPASSDCGIALGCALWGYHMVLKAPRGWVMNSASLGKPYTQEEVQHALEARTDEVEWQAEKNIARKTAELIAQGNIIGWFQGGAEYGPRALGNRSIVSDARDPNMKDTLNNRVKHREAWRPFAASILREHLSEWFDIDTQSPATAFMLLAAPVREEQRARVPSIVHVDGTCRMQTLTPEANGRYYDLVKEFNALTGVPLILNTSFNLGGEPIVETPEDALSTFLRTNMDYLVLENMLIRKK